MDAIRALIEQHQVIVGLFDAAARGQRRRARSGCVARLAEELIVHLAAEEAVLYPSVQRVLLGEGCDSRDERRHEPLLLLRTALRRVLEAGLGDSSLGERVAALRTLFVQHVREQELNLFPQVMREVSEATREVLGAEILASRPPVWIVTTEGHGPPHAGDEWAARSRVSLLLS